MEFLADPQVDQAVVSELAFQVAACSGLALAGRNYHKTGNRQAHYDFSMV